MSISLIASVSNPTPTTSGAIDTTGAYILIAVLARTTTGSTVSDSKANTWTLIGTVVSPTDATLEVFAAFNPTVGSGHTFTNTGGFSTLCIGAFGGENIVVVSSLTPSARATNQVSPGTSIQAGNIVPIENGSLVIAALAYRDTTAVSINSSFTIAQQRPFIGGTAVGSALAYRVQGLSPSAVNPTYSWTNSVNATALNQLLVSTTEGTGGGGDRSYVS